MPTDGRLIQRDKLPEGATLTLALVLYAFWRPSVFTYWLIACLSSLGNKSLSKNIVPTSEQTTEDVQAALDFSVTVPFWLHPPAAILGRLRLTQQRRTITFQAGILRLQFLDARSQAKIFSQKLFVSHGVINMF